jgi:hypothetical protein
VVTQYKYLGIVINEFIDYNVIAQILADAANRALGSIINKYKKINGLGYYTYTKLFQSAVCPILDYASEVWGYKKFPQIEAIQNKAIRIFLGVHKFVPAINGDIGWTASWVRRKTNIIRFWNRLMCMNEVRLPKIIFNWDCTCRGNTWSSNIKSIFDDIDYQNVFISRSQIYVNSCWALLHELHCKQWSDEISRKPKLRTYVTFKHLYQVEPYVISFMNRKHRSYLAQYRCGILPLSIETGRWRNIPLEDRICKVCDSLVVEDEYHFIFHCSLYKNIRDHFLHHVGNTILNINEMNEVDKIKVFMSKDFVSYFAKIISEMIEERHDKLFVKTQ